jgi:hypothetical protein
MTLLSSVIERSMVGTSLVNGKTNRTFAFVQAQATESPTVRLLNTFFLSSAVPDSHSTRYRSTQGRLDVPTRILRPLHCGQLIQGLR